MKKVLTVICSMLLFAGAYAYEVNEKVLKSFQEIINNKQVFSENARTFYQID